MRGVVVICLGLAACYSPQVTVGATCDPSAPACPSGEHCVDTGDGYHCESGGSGPIDAPPSTDDAPPVQLDAPAIDPQGDEDGDNVKNGVDNCPMVANTDQHDEDGDHRGDACDPCPIIAAGLEPDSDGDQVGDNCDPHPNTPGDHIYLFETFKGGVPSGTGWDPFGPWAASGDSITVSVDASHANLGFTMPTTGTEMIITTMTLTSIGTANNRGAGLIDEKGAAGSDGVACDLYDNTAGNHVIGLVHASTATNGGTDIMSTAMTWALNTKYVVVETRKGTSYGCTSGANGVMTSSTITNALPEVGFYASNASAKFDYIFVVTSP